MHRGKVDPGASELPRGNELSRDHVNRPLITNVGPCGYFNAISEKHLRYSLFVKRIIAIEAQLYFLGLVRL